MAVTVSTVSQSQEGCSEHGNERIGSVVLLMKSVVAIIRSYFSVSVFVLLLCSVFPVEQMRWAVGSAYGSIGDIGHEQACDFSGTGAATESEGDSSQETPDDCVAFGMSVSDCGSSRFHTSMNEIAPSTLLVSQLLEPPAV